MNNDFDNVYKYDNDSLGHILIVVHLLKIVRSEIIETLPHLALVHDELHQPRLERGREAEAAEDHAWGQCCQAAGHQAVLSTGIDFVVLL